MEYLGVRYEAKHLPELDPQFVPFGVWMNAYRVGAEMPLAIAVERDLNITVSDTMADAISPAIFSEGMRPRSWNMLATMVVVEPTGSFRT